MPHQIFEENVFPKSSEIVIVLAQCAELLRHPRNGRKSVFLVCDAMAGILLNDHVPTLSFHVLVNLNSFCSSFYLIPYTEAPLRETTSQLFPQSSLALISSLDR